MTAIIASTLAELPLSSINAVVIALFAAYFAFYLWGRLPADYPPGSYGLPIVGNLPFMNTHAERVLSDWNTRYGPVCFVKIGSLNVVLLGSTEAVHEAFVKKADTFSGRIQCLDVLMGCPGIILADNSFHLREQRRFNLNVLREFGMGRRSIEPRIIEKCAWLCENIDERIELNKPFDIEDVLYATVSGVISQLTFNNDLANQGVKMKEVLDEMVYGNTKVQATLVSILLFAPFLKGIPPFSSVVKASVNFKTKLEIELRKAIREHSETRDQNDPRDIIDRFLGEMENVNRRKKGSQKTDENQNQVDGAEQDTSFTEEQLIGLLRDLFLAGTDTSSATLCWTVLYLASNEQAQKKLQAEIDSVLGSGTVPSLAKEEHMPYTRAVIQEVLRLRPVAPLGVPHAASRDGYIMGYKIPKGSMIISNLFHIHHNPKLWPDPERFDPERHLEKGKFVKSPNVIPFSLGARQCLGMQLAKMELFLVLTSLYQRYTIQVPDFDKLDMRGHHHFTLRQPSFKVIVKKR